MSNHAKTSVSFKTKQNIYLEIPRPLSLLHALGLLVLFQLQCQNVVILKKFLRIKSNIFIMDILPCGKFIAIVICLCRYKEISCEKLKYIC